MLPVIGGLGGALLGVFAVEKIGEWTKEGLTKLHEMYTEVDQDIKTLDAAGAAALKHIGAEADSMLTHFKTSLAGEFNIAEIDARAAQLERYHEAFAAWSKEGQSSVVELARQTPETIQAIAEAEREGLQSIKAVDEKLAEIGALQFAAHKQMTVVTEKEAHELCEFEIKQHREAATAAHKATEERIKDAEFIRESLERFAKEDMAANKKGWEALTAQDKERARIMAEAGKAIAAENAALEKQGQDVAFLDRLDLNFLNTLDQITGVQQGQFDMARSVGLEWKAQIRWLLIEGQ